jgi:hypothetical protein
VVVIDGGVSNCSTYRSLFLRLSNLELRACSMSSTSTGAGEEGHAASVGGVSSGCDPFSRCFLRDDMCGSFFALFAEPNTNTNFASNSLAMVWRACLRVWSSTLSVAGVALCCLVELFIFNSKAFIYRSILSSRASINSVWFGGLESLTGVRVAYVGLASRASSLFCRSASTLSFVVFEASIPFR